MSGLGLSCKINQSRGPAESGYQISMKNIPDLDLDPTHKNVHEIFSNVKYPTDPTPWSQIT